MYDMSKKKKSKRCRQREAKKKKGNGTISLFLALMARNTCIISSIIAPPTTFLSEIWSELQLLVSAGGANRGSLGQHFLDGFINFLAGGLPACFQVTQLSTLAKVMKSYEEFTSTCLT
jgi:hypothetical protein